MLTILNGDAAKVLRTLPDKSCSMVLTSPPYDDLRNYLFANAVVWRDDVTNEEKTIIVAELKAAGIKPRTSS